MIWVNQILQGILLGGYYALLACGLSLMFGILRIINLAHGDLAVVGAFVIWYLAEQYQLSPFLTLIERAHVGHGPLAVSTLPGEVEQRVPRRLDRALDR